jgi:hypothetical protein
MRRHSLLIFLAIILLPLAAQKNLVLTKGSPVFVYALPKTVLCFDVEVEKITQIPGQFYQYSQRYLGTTDVITEQKVGYRVKSINMHAKVIADPARTFQMDLKAAVNYPVVNNQGILCGVNVPLPENKIVEKKIIKSENTQPIASTLLPLGEEFMMAGSTAKLAEGAAKQIYRIRESRMMLLGGDMEAQPSDGKALNTMLEGLERTEAELTTLFTGKTNIETKIHTITFIPDSVIANKVLFRLSAQRGLVDAGDLGGAPFYVSIFADSIKHQAPDPKTKHEQASIFTVLPAKTKVNITDGSKIYLENELEVPQFGVVIPLSEKIFKLRNVKIQIDPNTGRLLSINK